ncbi:hypothetical protein [Nostoc sp.]
MKGRLKTASTQTKLIFPYGTLRERGLKTNTLGLRVIGIDDWSLKTR